MALTIDKELVNKPKEKHWITYIKQRIRKNKNFLGFISGQTGSGKSWTSLSICEDLDSEFNIDRVVFSGIELMKLINGDKLKRGSAIVFEEVGVEMSNKNWASVTNKMLNYLVQTFRHRGFILIMNSPYMDFVDSATRKLFHAEMSMIGINFKTVEGRVKPQLIQYNSRLQKFYYKRLKVITSHDVLPVTIWNVHKPKKDLIDAYELKKRAYTNALNEKILSELRAVEEKDVPKSKSFITDIQQETIDLLKEGMTIDQIAIARSRTKSVVGNCIRSLKKKGYKIKACYNRGELESYEVLEPEE